jgi:hypothetical protein
LGWESELWDLFWLLRKQWRTEMVAVSNGIGGAVYSSEKSGLDLNVFIPLIERKGWDMTISLELLSAIEDVMLSKEVT